MGSVVVKRKNKSRGTSIARDESESAGRGDTSLLVR